MARYTFIAAAVALSASLALAVTSLSPDAPAGNAGGSKVAAERIIAAHTIVDDYLKMTAEARLAADHAADAELAASRRQAAAQATLQTAATAPKQTKPMRVATVPLPEPAPITVPPVAAAPPPSEALQPAAAEHGARKRPVISRVVHTVERIPRWVGSRVVDAASWVIDLPSQAVARLPERRFL